MEPTHTIHLQATYIEILFHPCYLTGVGSILVKISGGLGLWGWFLSVKIKYPTKVNP